jgi:hypothetical protein
MPRACIDPMRHVLSGRAMGPNWIVTLECDLPERRALAQVQADLQAAVARVQAEMTSARFSCSAVAPILSPLQLAVLPKFCLDLPTSLRLCHCKDSWQLVLVLTTLRGLGVAVLAKMNWWPIT